MKKRKVIGCIINNPESQYQSRVLDGLISQCEAYDYDMFVFSPLVDVSHYFKEYMASLMTGSMNSQGKLTEYISECEAKGVSLIRPSVNESNFDFTVFS